jgi:hypothetical protein
VVSGDFIRSQSEFLITGVSETRQLFHVVRGEKEEKEEKKEREKKERERRKERI